jgi:hypothetical protein
VVGEVEWTMVNRPPVEEVFGVEGCHNRPRPIKKYTSKMISTTVSNPLGP